LRFMEAVDFYPGLPPGVKGVDASPDGRPHLKTIYFKMGDTEEQVEFWSDANSEEVKECFRSATESDPSDILKLYNTSNSLMNISPRILANSPDTRYTLKVVGAKQCLSSDGLTPEINETLLSIEKRLLNLEKKIVLNSGDTPPAVWDMRAKVENLREKLESVEHMSWLGLYKDIDGKGSKGKNSNGMVHCCGTKKTKEKYLYSQQVFEKFERLRSVELTDATRELLKKPTFDIWQWEDSEMLYLLQQMFVDLKLVEKLYIELPMLQAFLFQVHLSYNYTPYHNFRHCFCVTQMMYGLIWLCNLQEKLDEIELLILLVSAICHDLDHPGYNNAYQVNAKTELALRYNDISPLENHHAAVAFEILSCDTSNVIKHLTPENHKRFRSGMIKCILATDMARHNEIVTAFKGVIDCYDNENADHRMLMMMIFLKVSDISNEARPMDVSEPWVECLLQEFFMQSDAEKLEGLPVAPFMDREKVTKPSAQVGFIKFVLIPLYEALASMFEEIREPILAPVVRALEYYSDMNQKMEQDKEAVKLKQVGRRISSTIDPKVEPKRVSVSRKTSEVKSPDDVSSSS